MLIIYVYWHHWASDWEKEQEQRENQRLVQGYLYEERKIWWVESVNSLSVADNEVGKNGEM